MRLASTVARPLSRRRLASLLEPPKTELKLNPTAQSPEIGEAWRAARRIDGAMKRVGISCLRRSVVIAEMMRKRGMPVHIRLSISNDDPRDAHAEIELNGRLLRANHGRVLLA